MVGEDSCITTNSNYSYVTVLLEECVMGFYTLYVNMQSLSQYIFKVIVQGNDPLSSVYHFLVFLAFHGRSF